MRKNTASTKALPTMESPRRRPLFVNAASGLLRRDHRAAFHLHDRTLPFRVRLYPFGLGRLRRAVPGDPRSNPPNGSHVCLRFDAAWVARREEAI
jgi:hypothetical protein